MAKNRNRANRPPRPKSKNAKPEKYFGKIDQIRQRGYGTGKTHEKRVKEFTVRAHGKRDKEASNTASVKRKPKSKIKDKRTDGAGVTENAPYSDLAKYRMVTTSDDVVNSSAVER
ncbi:MAG: hypothetical protein ACLUSP_09975 [Christensenellales bacterium]